MNKEYQNKTYITGLVTKYDIPSDTKKQVGCTVDFRYNDPEELEESKDILKDRIFDAISDQFISNYDSKEDYLAYIKAWVNHGGDNPAPYGLEYDIDKEDIIYLETKEQPKFI
jgi:hypothetical protein